MTLTGRSFSEFQCETRYTSSSPWVRAGSPAPWQEARELYGKLVEEQHVGSVVRLVRDDGEVMLAHHMNEGGE